MGRTALYRDVEPPPQRARVTLDGDTLALELPDGRRRKHALDGVDAELVDGFAMIDQPRSRRFVRMLVLDQEYEQHVLITPPDQGTVAPRIVSMPEAPREAAILESATFDHVSAWILGGGRLGTFSIPQLAGLAQIASSAFAAVIGEACAQRVLEIASDQRGPMGGAGYATVTDDGHSVDASLEPLVLAARHSIRANEALMAALSFLAGRRRRWLRSAR